MHGSQQLSAAWQNGTGEEVIDKKLWQLEQLSLTPALYNGDSVVRRKPIYGMQ